MSTAHLMTVIKNPRIYLFLIFVGSTLITQLFIQYQQSTSINAESKTLCHSSPLPLFEQKKDKQQADAAREEVKTLNNQITEATKILVAPGSNAAEVRSSIKNMAERRKNLFLTLARNNPQEANSYILDAQTRSELYNFTENCIEVEKEETGQLITRHVDFYPDDESKDGVFLVQENDTLLQIHPTQFNETLVSGSHVTVKGYKLDNDFIVDSTNPDNIKIQKKLGFVSPAEARVDSSFGTQKLVVILANFSNTTPPIDKPTVHANIFTNVKNYYVENSYNNMTLSGSTVDWRRIGIDLTCDSYAIRNKALSFFDPYIDYRNYTRVMVVSPFTFTTCRFQGEQLGTQYYPYDGGVTLSSTVVAAEAAGSLYIPAHELGHDFGVHHASFNGSEYADPYDVMGKNTGRHMDAPHKIDIGWLSGSRVATISKSVRLNLSPMSNTGTSLKALRVPKPGGGYVFVEYRQAVGYDSSFATELPNSDVYSGALLHTYESNCYQCHSYLIHGTGSTNPETAALNVNQSYTIPNSTTMIKVISRTTSALTVDVWLNGEPPTAASPTPTRTPTPAPTRTPTPTPTGAATILYTKPYSSTTDLVTTTTNGWKNQLLQVKNPISIAHFSFYNTGCGHSFEIRRSSSNGELTGTLVKSGKLLAAKSSNYCYQTFTKVPLTVGYYVLRVYVGSGEPATYLGITSSILSDVSFLKRSFNTSNATTTGAFQFRIGYYRN